MYSDKLIQFNAPWHALKRVCVGSTYGPKFYQDIRNNQVRDSLQQISSETQEDYQNLVTVLQHLGVIVERIKIDPEISILDFVDHQGRLDYKASQSFTLVPRPPMQPRDSVLIVGDQAILTNGEGDWFRQLNNDNDYLISPKNFDAPLVTVIGDRLIVDCRDHAWLADYLRSTFPEHDVRPVYIGGHNDAVFSVLAPGVIVSTYHHTNYHDTFPGWAIKYVENQSWNAIPEWRQFKHGNHSRWWVPESMHNEDFAQFVSTWLNHWVGFVAESVFDVNMLQIDQNRVLVNNYNKELFDFLDLHAIEPIIVPFRHRFFWDGGLHCITNDLYREGDNDCFF